jgi:hypothetical protein
MASSSIEHNKKCPTRTRTLLRAALLLLCITFATRGIYYSLTKGFCLRRIQEPICFAEDLTLPLPSKTELDTLKIIANQPFRYLVKGSQAYAFISQDGRYILKLFKLHHLKSVQWLEGLPCPQFCVKYRDSLVHRRKYRTNLTLTSYKLAAENLKDECALLYTQILPSGSYSVPVTIIDAIGRSYTIDLAQSSFAIQKRASLVLPSLEHWITSGDITSAKKALNSMVSLIKLRSSKDIQDTDPDLHKNAGLIGTTAIHIDIGSFHKNPSIRTEEAMKADMKKIFSRLLSWLEPRSSELHSYLKGLIETLDCPEWPSDE